MKKFFESAPILFTTGGAEPGLVDDTVSNFKNAVRLGADVIRTNVLRTADGKVVVASDALYQQKELIKKGIGCFQLNALRKAYKRSHEEGPFGGEEEIFPELSLVLKLFAGQRFNLILPGKDRSLCAAFCDIIEKANAVENVIVSSFSEYSIAYVRRKLTNVATSFSFPGIIRFYALYKSGLLYFKKKFQADAILMPEMIGASFIANEGMIQEAKLRGIRVYVLSIDSEEKAKVLLAAGADGFVTGNVRMLVGIKGMA